MDDLAVLLEQILQMDDLAGLSEQILQMDDLAGFRFHPTDEEIIRFLAKKRLDPDFSVQSITETNIYDFEPADLFGLSQIQSDEKWCTFFCAPDYKNADNNRVRRTTKTGFWKSTGKIREINSQDGTDVIGIKRILVFYTRDPTPKGTITEWVMHEYSAADNPLYKKDFVVCRVKRKSNKKRRNSTYVRSQKHKRFCTSTELEHQQHQSLYNSIFNKDQVNHHLEGTLPKSDFLSRNYLVSNYRNHVAENTFLESQLPSNSKLHVEDQMNHLLEDNLLKSDFLLSNYLVSNYRNHVAENTFLESPLPSNSKLHIEENISISESRNRVGENTLKELEHQQHQNLCISIVNEDQVNHHPKDIFPKSDFLSSNYQVSNSRNQVAENTFLESRLPSNNRLHVEENASISKSRNRVEDNTSIELEHQQHQNLTSIFNKDQDNTSPNSQLQSINSSISNSGNQIVENALPVYSDLPTIPNALGEGNELAEASFSIPKLQSNGEQGCSYSSFSINDCPLVGSDCEIYFMIPQDL